MDEWVDHVSVYHCQYSVCETMETGKSSVIVPKKPTPTPKSIIHQKFGSTAVYRVEEIQDYTQNGCPGLCISQKGPCLYRCTLTLPECSIVSDICKRKKEAEQSAAEKAIEKLGINPNKDNPTPEEAWGQLVNRLLYLFSDEFLSSVHPVSGHLKAALQREGHLNGFVPVSAIAVYDAKICSLCKYIKPEVESNILLVMELIHRAAEKLVGSMLFSEDHLSLKKLNAYPPETMQSLLKSESGMGESIPIEVIRIPSSLKKTVEPMILNASVNGYYLDVIACELGLRDASKVLISRTLGRASSEMRLYYCIPNAKTLSQSSQCHTNQTGQLEGEFNVRASYLCGQDIFGDAILASLGYTWRSIDLFHEAVSLRTYYRLLASKIPRGIYKLSREAIIAAELPAVFTIRSNWKGSFPKEILTVFCRQHRLSEPIFLCNSFESQPTLQGSPDSGGDKTNGNDQQTVPIVEYKCVVKILSKCQDLIIQCSPKQSYKKEADAIETAALKVLSWLNLFFVILDLSAETVTSASKELDILIYPQHFLKEFATCLSVHYQFQSIGTQSRSFLAYDYMNQQNNKLVDKVSSVKIGGRDSGVTPSTGALVCISYSISLVAKGECTKEYIESSEEFEFEIGCGAVLPLLEAAVTQMSAGQSAWINMELPPDEFILAAAGDSDTIVTLLSTGACFLECVITLLRVTVPLEDRMEQALFKPPLSKQRVEYALQHIRQSCAASLVDLGCGSGSLLDSLLDYPSSLERIAGVDLSHKGLARAAKILHTKLNASMDTEPSINKVESAVLFYGSITNFDSRLRGFDIATCLEVIEHMEEDEACIFGNVVLSTFCPRILIVSTPNYEYNPILQRSTLQSPEEERDENQACKFRNHDHKFEWTREQFGHWATGLARRYNYSVEFSGVGGDGDKEPGFASQIAVFRKKDDEILITDAAESYEVVWEWNMSSNS
nr:small RNA 2'-O-methyltransferase [Ipomoea trifida]